jgi:hypothetical protein
MHGDALRSTCIPAHSPSITGLIMVMPTENFDKRKAAGLLAASTLRFVTFVLGGVVMPGFSGMFNVNKWVKPNL